MECLFHCQENSEISWKMLFQPSWCHTNQFGHFNINLSLVKTEVMDCSKVAGYLCVDYRSHSYLSRASTNLFAEARFWSSPSPFSYQLLDPFTLHAFTFLTTLGIQYSKISVLLSNNSLCQKKKKIL